MPINRMIWKSRMSTESVPSWPCPQCGSTALEILEGSYNSVVDPDTIKAKRYPNFDYMDTTGVFACILKCRRANCHGVCSVSGTFYTAEVDTGQECYPYESCRPNSILPPPPIIAVPRKCPPEVEKETKIAFALFWSDYSACLNRIRTALELLLDKLNVPRTTINKNRERVRLSLHSRIDKLKAKRPSLADVCEKMVAVKHLGNAGSHPGDDVAVDDVLDGFGILEYVLADMFSEHAGELARIVREINDRKGPRRR